MLISLSFYNSFYSYLSISYLLRLNLSLFRLCHGILLLIKAYRVELALDSAIIKRM